ncbi:hypothetical protein AVEN_14394-1 [Araneus ventricosus]|uniref:Uncharacterized protein n=1 Tax=Araneus ventricosus TaxID=182803 RepID=A0A4Y2U8F4_ARAVE|nr:hypothetical protein AVEN_14394-1 [Araneus ventricosus]
MGRLFFLINLTSFSSEISLSLDRRPSMNGRGRKVHVGLQLRKQQEFEKKMPKIQLVLFASDWTLRLKNESVNKLSIAALPFGEKSRKESPFHIPQPYALST